MSSSRVVRGTKGRILACICVVLVITGIIACYNNTLTQLDETRKANKQCHQQQENLSTQLQVIFDYKQRLEKSLKTEKGDHQQTRKELENRIEEERKHNEKLLNDANVKFSSLQQHYNLLQTRHEDFKTENSKIQQKKIEQVNQLQDKIKELENQLKQELQEKDMALQNLKNDYNKLQIKYINLDKQLQNTIKDDRQYESEKNHFMKENHMLQRELDDLKAKCSISHKSLNDFDMNNNGLNKDTDHNEEKSDVNNVGDNPNKNIDQSQNNNNEQVLAAPNEEESSKKTSSTHPNVININKLSSSKSSLIFAQPLNVPAVSPSKGMTKLLQENEMNKQYQLNVLPLPYAQKKIPVGVVPPPLPVSIENKEVPKPEGDNKENAREDVKEAFPNRYRANLLVNELGNEIKVLEDEKQLKNNIPNDKQANLKGDVGDTENNALEDIDSPLNDKLDGDALALNYVSNDDKVNNKKLENNIKQNDALNNRNIKEGQIHQKVRGQENGDYEKIVQNDMQLEEEAEDDDPDYADHLGRPKEPAVRN